MAFVKDEDHLLAVDWQVAFALHQVIELLDRGDDDLVVVLLQVAFEPRGAVGAVDAIGRKTLVLLHRLVVQIFPVHHEKHLVNEFQFRRQSRGFETGQRLARASGVPDVSHRFPVCSRSWR